MPNKQQKKIILINNCIEIGLSDSGGPFSSIRISIPKKIRIPCDFNPVESNKNGNFNIILPYYYYPDTSNFEGLVLVHIEADLCS